MRSPRQPVPHESEEASVLAPRTYLQACLLLLLAESPAHGYDLGGALSGLGLRIPDSGRVYRALREMERDGLVTSWWEGTLPGPARRMYDLTEKGDGQLEASAQLVSDDCRHLRQYLKRWARLALAPASL